MLRYIGNGWLPGIPARDISDAEIPELAKQLDINPVTLESRLLRSGLYEKLKPAPVSNKMQTLERENK